MEAGDRAAGHGDEHERPHRRLHGGGVHAAEAAPDLWDGVVRIDEDANRHAHGHDDQADAEYGIHLADDLVNGEERRNEIVRQNDNQPEQGGSQDACSAVFLAQLDDKARGAHGEHGAHHDQQHYAEHPHDVLHHAAQVDAGNLGDRLAVVALTHHTGEEVVDAAGQQGAEGDPQKDDGPPQGALQRAEDGPQARDIQQLHQEQLPPGKHHVVHAVVNLDGGRLTVVRSEGVLHHLAVDEVSSDQKRETDDETDHKKTSSHK